MDRIKNKFGDLLRQLGSLRGLEFSISTPAKGAAGDFLLRASAQGKKAFAYRLNCLWAQEGWPSEVRSAIAEVPNPWPRDWAVTARALSPGALELLAERDANWLDEAGNVRLVVPPGLFVVRAASARARPALRGLRWADSSTSIAEHLLTRRSDRVLLPELAAATGWSTPQVSNVLAAFDEKGWTKRFGPKRGGGVWRELANPGALLDAWSEHLVEDRPRGLLGHRLMREPLVTLREELAPLLGEAGKWAVSGWAGLELSAPYTSTVPTLQVYVQVEHFDQIVERLFAAGGIRKVDAGANIEVWELGGSVPLAEESAGGLPVVNHPRLYADLLAMGGRAKDGAQHLREVLLGY